MVKLILTGMAIWVVKFSKEEYKIIIYFVPFISYFCLLVFFVDSYQETKISAVKFVYFFFNSSKPALTEKFFVELSIRNLFSQQKVKIKKVDR